MRASVAFALLPAVALAQTSSSAISSASESSSVTSSAESSATSSIPAGETHTILVGEGGNRFEPESTTAEAGDVVEFHFVSNGHSVGQASFDDACVPLNDSDASFFSKGRRNQVFAVDVVNDDPIWFYCAEGGHCRSGMVGAINAATTGDRTLTGYKDSARSATERSGKSDTVGGVLRDADDNAASVGQVRWALLGVSVGVAALVGGMM